MTQRIISKLPILSVLLLPVICIGMASLPGWVKHHKSVSHEVPDEAYNGQSIKASALKGPLKTRIHSEVGQAVPDDGVDVKLVSCSIIEV